MTNAIFWKCAQSSLTLKHYTRCRGLYIKTLLIRLEIFSSILFTFGSSYISSICIRSFNCAHHLVIHCSMCCLLVIQVSIFEFYMYTHIHTLIRVYTKWRLHLKNVIFQKNLCSSYAVLIFKYYTTTNARVKKFTFLTWKRPRLEIFILLTIINCAYRNAVAMKVGRFAYTDFAAKDVSMDTFLPIGE